MARRADRTLPDAPFPRAAQAPEGAAESGSRSRDDSDERTPFSQRSNIPPAGAMVGAYEIIRPLGAGGMGEVLLSRDTRLGRLAALKFLSAATTPERSARFLAEARATARLGHENVVVIYEVGEHRGMPFMALEYVKGQTLRQWIEDRAARKGSAEGLLVPPRRAVELMLPVARALAHAHERGIVHRDLKPANVMIGEAGTIKVVDFGIAKILAEVVEESTENGPFAGALAGSLTQSGAALGTVGYMAPEQWGVASVDHRADLWAVGLMLHELLFGESPLAPLLRSEEGVLGLSPLLDLDAPLVELRRDHPELGKLGALIDRCLIKRKEDRIGSADELVRELMTLLPASPTAAPSDEERDPFAGLSAFQESDAERFFGRERAVHQAMARLVEQPLLAVVGPSGAGKSSFVRAGLIPALKQSGDGWEAFVIRPGPHPLAALAWLLGQHAWQSSSSVRAAPPGEEPAPGTEREAVVARLRDAPGYLGMQLRARSRRKRERILLFVDQFEELYTLASDADRAAFFACLAGVADEAGSPLRVVVAMRADFLDRLADTYAALPDLGRGFLLLPLDRAELREALTRPLSALDYRINPPALCEEMLDELSHTRGALPLLQFTAARLWEHRDRARRVLDEESYRKLGGVAGTLAKHADAVLGAMAQADKQIARAIFLRLVTPERTRALVSLRELHDLGHGREDLRRVLDRLLTARLLTLEGSGEDEGTLEIVHESLVTHWPALSRWLDEDSEDAAFLAHLRGAGREWRAGGERDGLLWTGEAAGEAQRFASRYRGELAPSEKRFLDAVVALAERSRRRRRRLVATVIAALSVVAVLVSYLAIVARREAAEARAQRAETERGAARARNATRMTAARERQGDPTTVLALVRELEPGPTPRGWSMLARWAIDAGPAVIVRNLDDGGYAAVMSPDGRRIVSGSWDKTVRVWSTDSDVEPLILRGHTDGVYAVALSPDGRRIASGSADRTVRVWNADGTGEPLVLRGHEGPVPSVAWSPDGRRIASASWDGTMRVWDADGSGQPLVVPVAHDRVTGVAFSPDGLSIVSSSYDKLVRIWSADGSGAPRILKGHEDRVYSAAFSPDGHRVVSTSFDRTVRIWNADGSGQPVVLRGHERGIIAATFSPDGRRVVSGSVDRTARVWNADGSGWPLVLRGHDDQVSSATWSPDGRRVITASVDRTVRVWNVDGSVGPRILRGHEDAVAWAAWSPDGRRIASASADKTVRVWIPGGTAEPLVLRGHKDVVNAVAWSPDGGRVASASQDMTLRVWNADGTGEPLVLRGHEGAVISAAFSPDGRHIVSASYDKTVRIWSADGEGVPLVLRGHEGSVVGATYRPDGLRIASASQDKTVRIWNADGSGQPLILRGHEDECISAVWSPDGRRVVSTSWDKTVRVWSEDGALIRILRGHESAVGANGGRSWSPDGTRLVTHSADATIRVWKIDGEEEPLVLRGAIVPVQSAAFSPDGTQIASAADDGTVTLWSDLEPLHGPDDPRLWAATDDCMPVEVRERLLDVPEDAARADLQRCRRRVREVAAERKNGAL